MFACTSSAPSDASESSCTLSFASRVRQVQMGAAKAKKSKSNQVLVQKLGKVEQSLADSQNQNAQLAAEITKLRNEFNAERAASQASLAEAAAKVAEKSKALEAEVAARKAAATAAAAAAATIAAIPPPVVAPVVPAPQLEELQQLLRAKEREILELKLQRSNLTLSASTFSPPSAAPHRTLPQIHFAPSNICSPVLASAAAAVVAQRRAGVNLLDIPSLAESIPCSFDDSMDDSTLVGGNIDSSVLEEVVLPPAAKRDSLTGNKRKTSPSKAAEEQEGEEAEEQEGDENDPTPVAGAPIAMAAGPNVPAASAPSLIPVKTISKKARITVSVQPSTPRSALGSVATAVAAKPATRTAGNKSLFHAGNKTLSTPMRSKTTQSKMSKPAPIVATPLTGVAAVAAAANAALLDQSVEDWLISPQPNPAAAKSVRFGQATTKFITPDSTPVPAPAAAAVTGIAAAITQPFSTSISTAASLESLRVKTRASAASKFAPGSALMGGAKRQAVKPVTGWQR
jgi:hypothetical protein